MTVRRCVPSLSSHGRRSLSKTENDLTGGHRSPELQTSSVAPCAALYDHNRPDLPAKILFGSLLYPEAAAFAGGYKESRKPALARPGSPADLEAEGYRVTPHPGTDDVMVDYRARGATPAMVGEMALLRVAELARAAHKSGFIILSRRDTNNDINYTRNGAVEKKQVVARQTFLEVTFVDPSALPSAYAKQSWRVLDANEVYATLAPVYLGGGER